MPKGGKGTYVEAERLPSNDVVDGHAGLSACTRNEKN